MSKFFHISVKKQRPIYHSHFLTLATEKWSDEMKDQTKNQAPVISCDGLVSWQSDMGVS